MKNVRTVLAALLPLFVGCVAGHRYAYTECVCPPGQLPRHEVSFSAPTKTWRVSGHGLYLYREIRNYAILLPEQPAPYVVYAAAEVSLFDTSRETRELVALTGGTVELDSQRHALTLSFQTSEGSFWANGSYPLDKD